MWWLPVVGFVSSFVGLTVRDLIRANDVTACLLSTNYGDPNDGLAEVHFACYETT